MTSKIAKKTFFANPSQYKYLLFQSHYIKLKPPGIPSILYILHGANQNLGSEKSMQLSHGVMLHWLDFPVSCDSLNLICSNRRKSISECGIHIPKSDLLCLCQVSCPLLSACLNSSQGSGGYTTDYNAPLEGVVACCCCCWSLWWQQPLQINYEWVKKLATINIY